MAWGSKSLIARLGSPQFIEGGCHAGITYDAHREFETNNDLKKMLYLAAKYTQGNKRKNNHQVFFTPSA